ncbi:hypothetical protein COT94_04590 [Candidatus Falkowbacteria bacterium CG10_big_fil_rev_8_21_14_0_10_37_14]|uniref:Replication-associated protein ORF2/G2P domain-containing protein n=1 Tax=Candidatus Falkowbacteria bacterium CG10_big_fil_rev_8_21_14_0_10_37_14 TaxID=1974561 RepID=A0A2M6WSD2_9BACT|nr:hypothetical protein [Candidatus Falkowbacteria bacterium]PIT95662.1 MAG: hypothetical protein COT94_04590 [Candidatus Falkowbacteria bacterium CG10_big_fil_rev_8_21_14_0_10_37_14]
MAYSFCEKIIVSGKSVEISKSRRPSWGGYQTNREKSEPKQLDAFEEQKRKVLNKQKLHSRSKTKIKRLVNANTQWSKFFTLTFAENITDKTMANYLFTQFIKRLKYHFPEFNYLAVPERQKRGAIHYHLICNLGYVDYKFLFELWGYGRIELADIRSVKKIGAYISKYLTKGASEFCKKSFFCSRKIKRPIEIIGFRADIFKKKFLTGLEPIFTKQFYSEWTGIVDYSEYLLDFSPFPNGIFDRSVLSILPKQFLVIKI